MSGLADFQLAVACYRRGEFATARRHCDAALKRDPKNPNGLQLLAIIQLRQGDAEASVETFALLLRLAPNAPDALMNCALGLQKLNRLSEALTYLDRAVKVRTNYAEAFANRSSVLSALGRYPEALESADRALALSPGSVNALYNRANALRSMGRYQEALPAFGLVLKQLQASQEAIVGLDEAAIRVLIFEIELRTCDWSNYDATVSDLASRLDRGGVIHPFSFCWWNRSAADEARCAKTYAAHTWQAPQRPLPGCRDYGHERLRLGYFSPDFREHPVASSFAEVIELHDRSRFEVCAISFGASDGSAMRARLEKGFDRFYDVRTLGDRALAEKIRQEEIDIVVDLAGYTMNNRGNALAYRPAPVAVNFQAFGTGAPFLDYLISDRNCIPEQYDPLYREKIVRMPESCYKVNDGQESVADATPSRASQGLPDQGFVFCSFCFSPKITPEIFDVWMRLLRSVERSVLWLRSDDESTRANLRKEAEHRGVAADLHAANAVVTKGHLTGLSTGSHRTASIGRFSDASAGFL